MLHVFSSLPLSILEFCLVTYWRLHVFSSFSCIYWPSVALYSNWWWWYFLCFATKFIISMRWKLKKKISKLRHEHVFWLLMELQIPSNKNQRKNYLFKKMFMFFFLFVLNLMKTPFVALIINDIMPLRWMMHPMHSRKVNSNGNEVKILNATGTWSSFHCMLNCKK